MQKTFSRFIIWTLILLPVIFYCFFIFKFSINVPFWDDYDSFLSFLQDFDKQDLVGKLGILFSQHNEHRIFLARISGLLDYVLTGSLHFNHLIYFGNILLLLVGLFLFLFHRRTKNELYTFLPITLLLFNFQTASLWATGSLQHPWDRGGLGLGPNR